MASKILLIVYFVLLCAHSLFPPREVYGAGYLKPDRSFVFSSDFNRLNFIDLHTEENKEILMSQPPVDESRLIVVPGGNKFGRTYAVVDWERFVLGSLALTALAGVVLVGIKCKRKLSK